MMGYEHKINEDLRQIRSELDIMDPSTCLVMEEKARPARKATNMPERQVCQILLDTLRDQTIKAKALYYEIKLNKYYPKETTMY